MTQKQIQLIDAAKQALDAMEMQTKRQLGTFHINTETASVIWFSALKNLKTTIEDVEIEEEWLKTEQRYRDYKKSTPMW
jgi:hypothetical protein